jgi:hypothetical protein
VTAISDAEGAAAVGNFSVSITAFLTAFGAATGTATGTATGDVAVAVTIFCAVEINSETSGVENLSAK